MSAICEAIRLRRLLRVHYEPGERLVEPHIHGMSSDGHWLLRAYQISGASASDEPIGWKLFRLDRLALVTLTTNTFVRPRPDFNPEDPAMTRIHCRVVGDGSR